MPWSSCHPQIFWQPANKRQNVFTSSMRKVFLNMEHFHPFNSYKPELTCQILISDNYNNLVEQNAQSFPNKVLSHHLFRSFKSNLSKWSGDAISEEFEHKPKHWCVLNLKYCIIKYVHISIQYVTIINSLQPH